MLSHREIVNYEKQIENLNTNLEVSDALKDDNGIFKLSEYGVSPYAVLELLSLTTLEEQVEFLLRKPLAEHGDDSYNIYGDTISSYEHSFSKVNQKPLMTTVQATHAHPVVVDLMSPVNTAIELKTKSDWPLSALAVSLEDKRNLLEKRKSKKKKVKQITANLINLDESFQAIQENTPYVSAFIQRGLRGLLHLPYHKDYYLHFYQLVWDALEDNGIYLGQIIPSFLLQEIGLNYQELTKSMTNQNIETIFANEDYTAGLLYGAFFFRKRSDARNPFK